MVLALFIIPVMLVLALALGFPRGKTPPDIPLLPDGSEPVSVC